MRAAGRSACVESFFHANLPVLRSSPAWARATVRQILTEWRVRADTVESAELLTSELVTNAVLFSGTSLEVDSRPSRIDVAHIALTLRRSPGLVRVEVCDENTKPPILRSAPEPDAEGGRGLILVNAMSVDWGYFFPQPGWKAVYFVLDAPELGAGQ